jgi:hypothetical protein
MHAIMNRRTSGDTTSIQETLPDCIVSPLACESSLHEEGTG